MAPTPLDEVVPVDIFYKYFSEFVIPQHVLFNVHHSLWHK